MGETNLVEYPALLWTRPNWAPRILCMLLIRGLRQCSDKVLAIIVHLTHTHTHAHSHSACAHVHTFNPSQASKLLNLQHSKISSSKSLLCFFPQKFLFCPHLRELFDLRTGDEIANLPENGLDATLRRDAMQGDLLGMWCASADAMWVCLKMSCTPKPNG